MRMKGRFAAGLFGQIRLAWLPVLAVYFAYGASALVGVATVFLQKDLGLTPAEVAGIGFWLGLPWASKMVVGVASDRFPVFGSHRTAYLLLGVACALLGYGLMATVVVTKGQYLSAMLLVALGYMIQDVIADALSVELARDEEELGQLQALGRMAVLAGGIGVAYLGGLLAQHLGARAVFGVALAPPVLVLATLPVLWRAPRRPVPADDGPLGGGRVGWVLGVGLGYAALGVALNWGDVPYAQELVLAASLALLGGLLVWTGFSRGVLVAAAVIFLFRVTPGIGQGYNWWTIDRLGFDPRFVGVLAQTGAVFGLIGLLVFRRPIVTRPVSFTLFWVTIAGTLLSLPNIGLFYGANEWLGLSARAFAFIDTTISAPLSQLTMVPMLILIARSTPAGAEATLFALMASWMNLALSGSELFTRYLNEAFQVVQGDYDNLGLLMIAVALIGLTPLLGLPWLRRSEAAAN